MAHAANTAPMAPSSAPSMKPIRRPVRLMMNAAGITMTNVAPSWIPIGSVARDLSEASITPMKGAVANMSTCPVIHGGDEVPKLDFGGTTPYEDYVHASVLHTLQQQASDDRGSR